MENETQKPLLPMGTIFKLKGIKKTAIICGRYCKDDSGEDCDYILFPYPEGRGEYPIHVCDNEEIDEIVALGYYDTNDKNYSNEIQKIIKDNNIKTDNLELPEVYPNPSIILPVGAVLRYKKKDLECMIVGHASEGLDGTIYDYMAYSLPDGDAQGAFDHEEIAEEFDVLSSGYINKECYRHMRVMEKALDKVRKYYNQSKGKTR